MTRYSTLDEIENIQQLALKLSYHFHYLQHNPNKLSWLPSNLYNTEVLHFSQPDSGQRH